MRRVFLQQPGARPRGLQLQQLHKSTTRSIVMGCGSNVVDEFYPLRRFPKMGEKQYFMEESICSNRVVGGVTLNHLAWARTLGAPTGLMALQGADEKGEMIRQKLTEMGVDISAVRISEDYATSVSHILTSAESPERTILMAPASTSTLTAARMGREFGTVLRTKASMVTTEISQLPLSGVLYLLETAQQAGKPSLVDIDVTPEVALGPAKLGTRTELLQCLQSATVAKLTADAAAEVLSLVAPGARFAESLEEKAQQLAKALNARLCVITDGGNGLGLALGGDDGDAVAPVFVPAFAGVAQVDTTGAGDAAFGGVIAALHAKGFPRDAAGLERVGMVAAAAGAACVEVQGALPLPGKSARRMVELAGASVGPFVEAAKALDIGLPQTQDPGDGSGGAPAVVSPVVQAYVESIKDDAKALRTLSSGLLLQQKEAKLRRAVALIAEAHVDGTGSKAHVYTTGIGKSGLVAARLAASLRSISIRASHVPGNEWVHGDLGTMARDDVLICLSHSGRTTEMVDVTRRVRARGGHVLAITGDARSPLAAIADVHLHAAVHTSEYLGKVPSRSIVVAEAIANGLVCATANATALSVANFLDNHPGGSIGSARGGAAASRAP